MAKIDTEAIKRLRDETGAPVMRAKTVLEEVMGDLPTDATPQQLKAVEEKAKEILRKEGHEKAEKRTDRVTGQGLISTYVHHSGKVASLVELLCETDFVAKNDLFNDLAYNVALQVASMDPENLDDLLAQEFIKDPEKTIQDLVKDVIAKTGENIQIGRFQRMEIGK